MRILNIIRKLIKLPIVIMGSPFILALSFLDTDWEDDQAREFFFEFWKDILW